MEKNKIAMLLAGMFALGGYFLLKVASSLQLMEIVSYVFLFGLLITITRSNIKHRIYEDKLTLPTMGIGILANILIAFNSGGDLSLIFQKIGLSVLGILMGGGGLYLLGLVADFIFKKESIGGGDIKLVAAMGAFVGPFIIWIIPIWLLSVFIFGVIYKIIGILKKDNVPSVIPTAPVHFVALASLIFIQRSALDSISVIIVVVILFLGCNCLFSKNVSKNRTPKNDYSENDEFNNDQSSFYANIRKLVAEHRCEEAIQILLHTQKQFSGKIDLVNKYIPLCFEAFAAYLLEDALDFHKNNKANEAVDCLKKAQKLILDNPQHFGLDKDRFHQLLKTWSDDLKNRGVISMREWQSIEGELLGKASVYFTGKRELSNLKILLSSLVMPSIFKPDN